MSVCAGTGPTTCVWQPLISEGAREGVSLILVRAKNIIGLLRNQDIPIEGFVVDKGVEAAVFKRTPP